MPETFKPFEFEVVPLFVDQFEINPPSALEDRPRPTWVSSRSTKNGQKYSGDWKLAKFTNLPGIEGDHGLLLGKPGQFYGLSAKLEHEVSFDPAKPFILQYEVKHNAQLDCSGAYLKLISSQSRAFDQRQFNEQTPASILFGPDYCGGAKDEIVFSFAHENPTTGKTQMKHLKNPPKTGGNTSLTCLYTLIVESDQSFKILLNNAVVREGSLLTDFEPPVNQAAFIEDPTDQKPSWWDDREYIEDPTAFSDEPSIIKNPKYDGKWVARQIKNPEYFFDTQPNKFQSIVAVGIEVWSQEGGIMFDNILMTHDYALREKFTGETWQLKNTLEAEQLEKILKSPLTTEAEAESIGRHDYDWIGATTVKPNGFYEIVVCSWRNAVQIFNEDQQRFKSDYAQPMFFGCISAVLLMIVLGKVVESLNNPAQPKKPVKKVPIAEEEDYVLPGEIQKTVAVPKPEPVVENVPRRSRQFSSPLQHQASFSVPASPSDLHRRPSTIFEDCDS